MKYTMTKESVIKDFGFADVIILAVVVGGFTLMRHSVFVLYAIFLCMLVLSYYAAVIYTAVLVVTLPVNKTYDVIVKEIGASLVIKGEIDMWVPVRVIVSDKSLLNVNKLCIYVEVSDDTGDEHVPDNIQEDS